MTTYGDLFQLIL